MINWAAPIRAKQSESCEWAYRIGKLGVGRHIVVVTDLETGGQSLFLVRDSGESQLLQPAYPEFSGPQFENIMKTKCEEPQWPGDAAKKPGESTTTDKNRKPEKTVIPKVR